MKRVVITGIGPVSPIGCGINSFIEGLENKASGFRDPKRINTDNTKAKYCAEIIDYQPEKLVSPKVARRINRFGLIAMGLTKMAFDDAKITVPYQYPEEAGLILSTDYGPCQTVNDYMTDLYKFGPSGVSPTLFSQTVMNVAIGYVSIEFKLKGISTLVQGCDGLLFACEHIRSGDNQVILVGGVEELIQNTFESYDTFDYISKQPESCLPMDRNSTGAILGEGGCGLVLEDYEHAKENNRDIYGEIAGIGISADSVNNIYITEKDVQGVGLQLAMERAIENANIDKSEIAGIYSCANGSKEVDTAEYNALGRVFGNELKNKWVVCGKSYYGECFHASNFFNIALALIGLKKGFVYPNRRIADPLDGFVLLADKKEAKPSYVICNSIYTNGTNVSVVLKNVNL